MVDHSRRHFIQKAGLASVAGIAAPFALQLGSMAPVAAAQAGNDYRALVCVFLYGGNDQWNTFIPADAQGYRSYAQLRSGIAREQNSILRISPTGGFASESQFGFAPELTRLRGLFDDGDAVVVSNVGTLLRPLTKGEFNDPGKRPPQLFSHNDQQSFWQSGSLEGAQTGWGGRVADAIVDLNAGDSALFTSISAAGNAVMMSGRDVGQYQVSGRGVTTLREDLFVSDSLNAELARVMNQPRGRLYPRAYADVTRRALSASEGLSNAITRATAGRDFGSFFDMSEAPGVAGNLVGQLEIVAQLIAAGRDELGLRRQIFFVGLGGFDNHSRLSAEHPPLLQTLDIGLAGFHTAMDSIGANSQVTTFTASDFGRSLVSNGDGTDHGWGGHHLVVGGAVNGNRVIGKVPLVGDDRADDVGRGRLLPQYSVDQYAATLASWFGVPAAELSTVLPNLGNFTRRDLDIF